MYLFSALQGQGTSFCPSSSGMPTEWMQGTTRFVPMVSRTSFPIRVMIRMLTTT